MPTILDGRVARAELKKKLASRVAAFKVKHGFSPTLAIIQVGDRSDTASYIKAKKSFAAEIGVLVRHVHLEEATHKKDIISEIIKLNADDNVGGIILQLPLPEAIKTEKNDIIDAIDSSKDADGLSPSSGILPATARGVRELLDFYKISLKGKKVCVIGRSELVGTPIAVMCRGQGATVIVCHSKTVDLVKETSLSDVIVSAVGRPGLISVENVKSGQIIVDVGINDVSGTKLDEEIPKRKIVGDVDFNAVSPVLGDYGAITPVPGGVGPMTVLSLFENLMDLCDKI